MLDQSNLNSSVFSTFLHILTVSHYVMSVYSVVYYKSVPEHTLEYIAPSLHAVSGVAYVEVYMM